METDFPAEDFEHGLGIEFGDLERFGEEGISSFAAERQNLSQALEKERSSRWYPEWYAAPVQRGCVFQRVPHGNDVQHVILMEM
jgi:hypothetical protein